MEQATRKPNDNKSGDQTDSNSELEQASIGNTPFVSYQVKCPICETTSTQYDFQGEVFIVAERAMDMRPTSYVWKRKKYNSFNPLLYYIWCCPSCSYAANRQYFEDPTSDISLSRSNFRKRVSEFLIGVDASFDLKPLKTVIDDPVKMTFVDAIKLHLAAIAILEQVSSVRTRDCLPLGKYYLRLSWLYHEMLASKEKEEIIRNMMALKLSLQSTWADMPVNEKAAAMKALQCYETVFFQSRVPERKRAVHIVSQILARLQIKIGAIDEGRNLLWKSIQYCSNYKGQDSDEIKYSMNLSDSYREQVKQRIESYNKFISETQELLYSTRKKKEAEK